MGLVFLPEVVQGSQHRIGSRFPQTAEGTCLDIPAQGLQLFKIAFTPLPFGDPFQDVQQVLGPYPAKGTFPTRFLLRKLKEITGHIHHAGVFIHDHHSP